MDRAAFERAIAAKPGDDLPRLVYADFLDERGYGDAACEQRLAVGLRAVIETPDDDAPRLNYAEVCENYGRVERAEFIRVQCDLARHIAHVEHGHTNRWRRNREVELLTSFVTCGDGVRCLAREHWQLDSRPIRVMIDSDFHRGFVDSIRCTASDWQTVQNSQALSDDPLLRIGQAILEQQPVEHVEFTASKARLYITQRAVGEWSLECLCGNDVLGDIEWIYQSRHALIADMPARLSDWGIDDMLKPA